MAENNMPVQKSSFFLTESNSHFYISEIYAIAILPLCVRYKIGFQIQKQKYHLHVPMLISYGPIKYYILQADNDMTMPTTTTQMLQ